MVLAALGQQPSSGVVCCGGAACFLRAYAEAGREPPVPPGAFRSLLQQRAYGETLRLRWLSSAVLLLYLLLPFFSPEAPPFSPQQENRGAPRGAPQGKREGPPSYFAPGEGLEEGTAFLHGNPPRMLLGAPLPTLDDLDVLQSQQQQQQLYKGAAQLLLQLPLRFSRRRRLGDTPSCDSRAGQCVLSAGSNSSSSSSTNNNSNSSNSSNSGNSHSNSSSGSSSTMFSSLLEPWRSRLPLQWRWLVLCLLSLFAVSFLAYYSFLAAVSRGFSPPAAVPAAALVCCLVSAADYSLLLFGDTPAAAAAAAAAAGGAWRATRLARPLLLCGLQHSVRCLLIRIVKTLPQVGSIILALFLSVALFDWLGVILFAGTGGHEQFHNFQRGCVSLLLVVTTVRLPQVLLCGYTVHEAAVLFVIAFYLITAVLLGLFAAAFFSAFRKQEETDQASLSALRVRYLLSAFNFLREAGGGRLEVRQWHLFYEALAALPAVSYKPLTPEEIRLLLQQEQQQQQVSPFPPGQRRLGTAALVSPAGIDEADWPPIWGSGSSRLQDWVSDSDGSGEPSRILLQVSPVSASAAAADAAAEEEAQEAESLMRAWGVKTLQRGGDCSRRQLMAEAKAVLESLGETAAADGEISTADFVMVPAALAAVGKQNAAAAAKASAEACTPRVSLWSWGLNLTADIAVAVSLVVTFIQTRKFILTASTLTGEPIGDEAADGMPSSCFISHAASYWLQLGLSVAYVASAGTLLALELKHRGPRRLHTVNKFDICALLAHGLLDAACIWAGAASAFHPESCEDLVDDLSRCLAFARVLRGLRIGFRIQPLKQMVSRLLRAVRRLRTVMQVLLLLFYAYATVGMELFRGLIECELGAPGGGSPGAEAEGDPTDLGLLNFNDIFSSLVTLFLLTVNGWDDALKALVKHTSVLKCSLYFVSFYILTDTILLNLLVALVLEAYEQVSATPSKGKAAALDQNEAASHKPHQAA